jgi:DNA repair protein RecO
MAYETYTTQALVCGTFDRNTADRTYLLFTKDAGMLFADARSVRQERSRQRYALQDFSLVRVSLVKGKRGWKIGSVTALHNYYHAAHDKAARGSVVALCRLLRRFVRGEEPASDMFVYIKDALEMLSGDVSHRSFVDRAIGLHILQHLGYVSEKDIPPVLVSTSLSEISAHFSDTIAAQVERLYEQAIASSHL